MGTRNRFNPCHPCCEDNSPCVYLSSDSDELTITLDEFDLQCCDIPTEPHLNGSFVVQRRSPLAKPCYWINYSGGIPCYRNVPLWNAYEIVSGAIQLQALELDGGNYGWRCTVDILVVHQLTWREEHCTGATLVFEWDSGGSSQFDGTAPRTLTLVEITGQDDSDGYDNLDNVTCELT